MTFFTILIAIGIICFILYQIGNKAQSRKEETEGRIIVEETLSKTDLRGGLSTSVVSRTVDVRPIKEATAKRIIKDFDKPYSTEQKIIMDNPTGFVYFVSSYESRIKQIKYNIENDKPRDYKFEIHYVPPEDSDEKFTEKKFWNWAIRFNLAIRGHEIPTEEILKTFQLRKQLNKISDKQFTRIKPAIEHLLQLPDIDERLNDFLPRENFHKIKVVHLDTNYLYEQWDIIDGKR